MIPRTALLAAVVALAGCGKRASSAPDGDAAVVAGDDDAPADDVANADLDAAVAPPAPVEHAVWSFGPNRLMAHRVVDGELVIDAGSAGFARYTRFGLPVRRWKLGVEVDGERTAVPARGASLDLPLTGEQAAAAHTLVMRVHAGKAARLTVKLNGRKLGERGRVALVEGWQVISVDATGRWVEGENLLVLETDRGDNLAVRWLRVSGTAPAAHVPDDATASPVSPAFGDPLAATRWDGDAGGFVLTEDAGLAWYVQVPPAATLVADVLGACQVEVTARAGDARMVGGRLAGDGARLDLSPLADQVVRLELRGRDCPGGVVRDARITLPGPPPPPPPAGPPPRYVVFWVMDALRADRIPTYTPGARAEVPNFDRLATDGAVFRQHYVGGNESQASHSSMFTSLYPVNHKVLTAGPHQAFRIPKSARTVGQVLHDAGWTSLGVTANGFVGDFGGYARGFTEFKNLMQDKGVVNGIIYGATVVDAAIARLTAHKDDDHVFLFLGTIDTHSPWIARKPWIDRYDPGPYDGPFQRMGTPRELGIYVGQMGCHKVPPARDIQRLRAIYDSAISYQDALVGDLLVALDKLGIADQTMIVLTADHGEELFEDDRCGHGASLRSSLTRVPFLVHYPPRVSPAVVDEGSEGVDFLPTLLDTLDLPPLDQAQGETLRPLVAGAGRGWARPSIASQYEYAFAMRLGRWKAKVGRTATPVIVDMVADPDERTDLAATRPLERRYLTDHLGLYVANRAAWHKARWGVVSNMTEAAARELDGGTAP
ncbi:MAG: sulfatase-like hydrolase/transferase [Kofleriaceae bacterium]|nr:sulfatase-like hydrolase/transferase [Kofleriaceae bacterium]